MSTNSAPHSQPAPGRSPLAGSALLIADVATPLGLAVARRIAGEALAPVCVGATEAGAARADDEIARVRELNGLAPAAPTVRADVSTDGGARLALAAALEAHGRVDGVVITAHAGPGDPTLALMPLLPLLRTAVEVIGRQPAGKVLLALDVGTASGVRHNAAMRRRIDSAFETLVRATARTHFVRELCVNGLLVDPREDVGDQALLLAGGAPVNGSAATFGDGASARAAAAGVISMLASQTGCGITGQVFRIGSAPPEPRPAPEMAAVLARSLPLP